MCLTNQRIPGVGQAVRSGIDRIAAHVGTDGFDVLETLAALIVHDGDVPFGGLGTTALWPFDTGRTLRV
ncbi:MAG: hypothetical protein V3T90_04100 [Anaerolineae bacterium]